MFGFRKFNSVPTLPPELVDFVSEATKQSPIKIPQTLFPFAFDNILTSILTLFLITINIYIFIQLVKLLSEKNSGRFFLYLFLPFLQLLTYSDYSF